jgi:hypothetical protein
MASASYGLSDFVKELRAVAAGAADQREIINEVRPIAQRLALLNYDLLKHE